MILKKLKSIDCISFLFALFATLLLFISDLIQYQGTKVFLILFVAAFIITAVILVCQRLFSSNRIWSELAVFCTLPFFFILTAMIFANNQSEYTVLIYTIFFLGFFTSCFLILQQLIHVCIRFNVTTAQTLLKRHWLFLVLLLIMLAARLPYINLLPRWDSGEYYYRFSDAVLNYHYNGIFDFFSIFALCGHPTLAFSCIYMIGEWIAPCQIIGVSTISLIMTTLAFACIYRIILHIAKNATPVKAAIFTALLSMAPLFYSTSMYFNPDSTIVLFYIFFIYSFVFDHPLLAGVTSLMCFQTKETGLVLVGGFVIGVFIQHYLNRKVLPFVRTLFTDLRLYLILFATIMQLIYNKMIGGLSNWTQNADETPGLRWDNHGDNCLGFNPSFVLVKLKQFFILNFNWVVTIILVVSVIVIIVRTIQYKKQQSLLKASVTVNNNTQTDNRIAGDNEIIDYAGIGAKHLLNHIIWPIVSGYVAFILFSCLFISASVARYNMVGDVLFYMITFISFYYAVWISRKCTATAETNDKKAYIFKWAVSIFCGIFGILLCIQCFFTIDPLTKLAFRKLNSGNQSIYFMGKIDSIEDMYYGDYLIYNTQYTYIDKVYDKMLTEANYDPSDTDLVLADSNGSFIAGNVPLYYLNWDRSLNKRVFYSNENTAQMLDYWIAYGITDHLYETPPTLKTKALLVYNPYLMHIDIDHMIDKLSEFYEIGPQHTVSNFQGSIHYYEMTLKQQ